jgi:hypothetical protein
VPVALVRALRCALAGSGADPAGQLGLDQLLERGREDVAQRTRERGVSAGKARAKVG